MKLQKGPFDWCLSVYIFIWLYVSFDTVDILGQVILLGAVMYTVGFLAAFLLSFISCTPFPLVMAKNVRKYCWNLPCKCLYFYMEGFWIIFFYFA